MIKKVFMMVVMLILLTLGVSALKTDPGHSANEIGGTAIEEREFQNRTYSFPYRLGISTADPLYGLDVNGSLRIVSDLRISGNIRDYNNALGTAGQVLKRKSSGDGVEWGSVTNEILTDGNGLTGGTYDGSSEINWSVNTGTGISIAGDLVNFDCSEVEGTGINCDGESITLNESYTDAKYFRKNTDQLSGDVSGNYNNVVIDSGVITESKLDISNTPLNEYLLSWNNTASKFTWISQEDINVSCADCDSQFVNENQVDSITSAMITNGTVGSADINGAQVQKRVSGSCSSGSSIRIVNEDGTVICEDDDDGLWTNSSGKATYTAGNVGIGTTNPGAKLHVYGATTLFEYSGDNHIYVKAQGNTALRFSGYSDRGEIASGASRDLYLLNTGGNGIVIKNNGNVGIGTTTPGVKLDVNGSIGVTSGNDVCIEGGNCLSSVDGGYITSVAWDDTADILNITEAGTDYIVTIDNEADNLSNNNINDLSNVNASPINDQVLRWNSSSSNWEAGTDNVDDADADATNEIQDLSEVVAEGGCTDCIKGDYINESSLTFDSLDVGGGQGSDGLTIDTDGNLNMDGNLHLIGDGELILDSGIVKVADTLKTNGSFVPDSNGVYDFGNSSHKWKDGYFSGTVNASGGNSDNWNTAYSWGNHSDAGYIVSGDDIINSDMIVDGTVNYSDVDTTSLQRRVSGSCNAGEAIKVVNEDGTVICESVNSLWTNSSGNATYTSGNVGIGTTTPGAKLEVTVPNIGSTDTNVLSISAAGQGTGTETRLTFDNSLGSYEQAYIGASFETDTSDGYLAFGTRKTSTTNEAMRINRDGNVGIGTTSPSHELNVVGDANMTGTIYAHNYSGNSDVTFVNSSGDAIVTMKDDGKIGIGTASPSAKLEVETTGFMGGAAEIGSEVNASGTAAVAIGVGNNASGIAAIAMGGGTVASNTASTSMGFMTEASGSFSTAMGFQTSATGSYAAAIGGGLTPKKTTASGESSIAMGGGTTASGSFSTAMGYGTEASEQYSMATGQNSKANGTASVAMGQQTIASGIASTAMGSSSIASQYASIAMGYDTEASGEYSTAIGKQTTASEQSSTAMGFLTTASGLYSTAMGQLSTAGNTASTAMGQQTNANGIASTAMGYDTTANNTYSTAMGQQTIASGVASTSMGYNTVARGDYTLAAGYGSTANDSYSIALGYNSHSEKSSTAIGQSTTAIGQYSTAMGVNTKANGIASTAMGYGTEASGQASTSMGYETTASGQYSTAIGRGIEAGGDYSVAISLGDLSEINASQDNTLSIMGGNVGIGTTSPSAKLDVEVGSGGAATIGRSTCSATGSYAIATGASTNASGLSSTAIGSDTTASGDYSISMGRSTTASGLVSTAMGDYTKANNTASTAMGALTTASGDTSTAIGYDTTASGDYSTAIGYQSIASGPYSTAIGHVAEATSDYSTAIGNNIEVTGYSSFGIGLSSGSYTVSDSNVMAIMGGKVGIGTVNPVTSIHIADGSFGGTADDTDSKKVIIESSSNAALGFLTPNSNWNGIWFGDTEDDTAGGVIYDHSEDKMKFRTNSGYKVYIDNSGNVGLGYAIPSQKLAVNGNICEDDGSVTACSSDIRLKENIKPIENAVEYLSKFRPVEFTWKDSGEKTTGLIAQEVGGAYPELLVEKDDGYYTYNDPGFKYISIKAIQELKAENEAKQEQIDQLKQLVCLDHPEAEICQ